MLDPAAGRHPSILGVDSHDDPAGITPGEIAHQGGLLHRHRPENHPVESTGQKIGNPLQGTHPSPQLYRDVQCRGNGTNRCIVHRFASFGSVEVDQMQTAGPLLLPAAGLRNRVLAEAGHLVVIALMQTNAGAIQQIDGGDDLHGRQPSNIHPAAPRFNGLPLCSGLL